MVKPLYLQSNKNLMKLFFKHYKVILMFYAMFLVLFFALNLILIFGEYIAPTK